MNAVVLPDLQAEKQLRSNQAWKEKSAQKVVIAERAIWEMQGHPVSLILFC